MLAVPVEGVDVYVTNKAVDGKTLAELATQPAARGVFLRRIVRGATATIIPILPNDQGAPRRHSHNCRPTAGYRRGSENCWVSPIVPATSPTLRSSVAQSPWGR